jgi:hypothetical protein
VLEAVQKRLDENPHAMRTRRETSERPDGLQTKALPKVATEMALCVLYLQSDARLEHSRRARTARSDQGIGAGTHISHTDGDINEVVGDRSRGRPVTSRSSRGGNEAAEASDGKGHVGDSASPQAATCQYDAVDPDNRLIAAELERRWNQALAIMAGIAPRFVPRRAGPPLADRHRPRNVRLAARTGRG